MQIFLIKFTLNVKNIDKMKDSETETTTNTQKTPDII